MLTRGRSSFSTVLPGRSSRNGSASRLDAFGTTIHAERGTPLDAEDAAVVVRPERIGLRPRTNGSAPDDTNAVVGDVIDDVYLGNSRKVHVRLPDGSEALVRETATQRSDARPGDPVWLTFAPADAVALQNVPAPTGGDRP